MDPNKDTNLLKYVNKKLKQINIDYTIIDSDIDGHDESGPLKYVSCSNGWYDRSWNLDSAIKQEKNKVYEILLQNGLKYKKTTYYYNAKQLYELVLH
jgi:hypothetical protein